MMQGVRIDFSKAKNNPMTRLKEALKEASHEQAIRFALDACFHAMDIKKNKEDIKPLQPLLNSGYDYLMGDFQVSDMKKKAFQAHQLSRTFKKRDVSSLARAIGHALASIQVQNHALVSATFATLSLFQEPQPIDVVKANLSWQLDHLKDIMATT